MTRVVRQRAPTRVTAAEEVMMRPRPRLCAVLFSLTFLSVTACSGDRGPATGNWVAEWDTIGDTVVVRTISGSVWGEPLEMVEELSIGVLDGPEELMFGMILAMAVDAAGGIYAFDRQVPALRYFDAEGAYVRTLGGEGGGPGEYGDFAGAVVVRRDGKVVLADMMNTRLNLYEPDGTVAAHWPVQGGFWSQQGVVVDTADYAYVSILTEARRGNEPARVGYLRFDPDGNAL
ncbi:MAG TPA: 6-bladed beta-propeller, partial [Gemmatimonadota bacterium]|nr:6-bladed beta-propeller [Gemmatimonadota bacterium]